MLLNHMTDHHAFKEANIPPQVSFTKMKWKNATHYLTVCLHWKRKRLFFNRQATFPRLNLPQNPSKAEVRTKHNTKRKSPLTTQEEN